MLFSFPRATDAAGTALAACRALCAAPDPDGGVLEVRAGLDTGEADADDPASVPAYGAISLCTSARAGDILLGRQAHDVIAEHPPARATLIDEGLHRIDLGPSRRVYRLQHPDLPLSSGDLRTLDVLPNNLPVQLTSFVGRAREMGEVREALARARLVTLWGTGGSGKTRLAVHAGAALAAEYDGGAWFVDLSGLRESSLVLQAAAEVIGIGAGPAIDDALVERFAGRRALVILDNCEHVFAGARDAAQILLDRCPGVALIATSREPLVIEHEEVYPVPPLALPDAGADAPSVARADAVRLFAARARAVAPAFVVDESTGPHVFDVCRRIDGIPLAIELAATRLRVLGVAEIAERLGDRFRLLAGGAPEAPERQQTLRAMIDWSHELMTEPEQRLFRRLSVFAGSFSIDAVEAICSGDGVEEAAVLDHLAQLVERSMVSVEEVGARVRYRLLESIRDYARDVAGAADETDGLAGAHAAWLGARSRERHEQLVTPDQATALDWFASELPNLRAAFAWAAQHEHEIALELAADVGRFFEFRAMHIEGIAWIDRLERLDVGPSPDLVRALLTGETFARVLGRLDRAKDLVVVALAHAGTLGSERLIAAAHAAGGSTAAAARDFPTARARYAEAAGVLRDLPAERVTYAGIIGNLAVLAHEQGDLEGARPYYDESIALFRELGSERHLAAALSNFATLTTDLGEYGRSIELLEEALASARKTGALGSEGYVLNNLAFAYENLGDHRRAVALNVEVLALARETREMEMLMGSLGTFAEIALTIQDPETGARLLGFAQSLPDWVWNRAEEPWVDRLREALGEARAERLFAEGAAADVDVVCAWAADVGARALTADLTRSGFQFPDQRIFHPKPGSDNVFRRRGDFWDVTYGARTIRLRDSKGLGYIARLLRDQGREIPVVELVSAGTDERVRGRARESVGAVESHAGALLDPQAIEAYRARVADLEREIDEAASWGEDARVARARVELDAIIHQLSAAVGLGGRVRTAADPVERARKAVTNRIKDSIAKIAAEHPPLGKHLANAIRTGILCSYAPDSPAAWDV